jgi:glycosyltransferase involved in cell wall biosynthesis
MHTFAILAYKQSPFLEECIKSLLSQKVKSDIIISTSTPSDFIENLADKYNIPLYVNKKSHGIATDWNYAYNISKTEYVTLAHQDDIYTEDYLAKCMKKAERHPENLIIFTGYSELYGNEIVGNNLLLLIKKILLFPFLFTKKLNNKLLKKSILLLGSPISCPGVTYNKKNLQNFKFDESFSINMDWNAWIQLAGKKGSFVYDSAKLFLHRIHDEAETSKAFADNRRRDEDLRIFKKLWPKPLASLIAKIYSISYKSA